MGRQDEAKISTAAGCDAATPQREKTWDECGIEEKVERLRYEALRQSEVLQYTASSSSKALELAQRHQHGERGEVLVSADDRSNRLAGAEGRGRNLLR